MVSKKVSDSVSENIWYRKKYRIRYRKYFVSEKSFWFGFVQIFGIVTHCLNYHFFGQFFLVKIFNTPKEILFPIRLILRCFISIWWFALIFSLCLYIHYTCEIWSYLSESNWFFLHDPTTHHYFTDNTQRNRTNIFLGIFGVRLVKETHFSALVVEGNFITDAHHEASPTNNSSSFSLDGHQMISLSPNI